MSKFFGLIVVFVALTSGYCLVGCQESAGGEPAAAAEPYSYGYETDSHSAAEQRDPSGKVTGYYTIADADGRSRRVEYVADEAGFRAKVATNEVGTKSENSADVEVQASPPTEAQYSSQYSQTQYSSAGGASGSAGAGAGAGAAGGFGVVGVGAAGAPVASGVYNQQTRYASTATAQQPASAGYTSSSYYQQQQQVKPVQTGYSSSSSQYGYQPGYGAQYGYAPANQVGYTASSQYGYNNNPAYVTGYYQTTGAPVVGYNSGYYSNYNNHLPSQYYRSIQQVQQPNSVVGGYASQVGQQQQQQPAVGGAYSKYGSSSYRASSYSSNSASAPAAVTSSRTVTSGNPVGSSNYIVLKK